MAQNDKNFCPSNSVLRNCISSWWPRLSKDKILAVLGKKYIFFQLFKVKKDMFFQPVVQKLNYFPVLSKVDLSRNLEYSYIIRVRILGNVGNKIIHLHISEAYLKALAKHYDRYNHLLESIQNQNARNTFITNKT